MLEQLKNGQGGRKLHAENVAWSYGMQGHAQKMRRTMLRTGKQESGATVQSFKSLLG